MSKKPRFRKPFDSQPVKGFQTLVNLYDSTFIIFFITQRENYFEMSLLLIFEILGHFVNTLTADEKYYLCNS